MTTTRKQPVQMQRTPSPIELANAELARKQNELNAKNAAQAASQPAPTAATSVTPEQFAQLVAQMNEIMAQNQALVQQNAVLKAAKAGKAEKAQPQPENETISIKGDIMTITVDLSKDLGEDIKSGARKIVARSNNGFGFYNLMHKGVRYSLSCAVYHDNPNFDELDKAYKAEKKAAKN